MADTTRKITIPKKNLPAVNQDFNAYFMRYRIVSQDKNLTSEWSAIHEIPKNITYVATDSGNLTYNSQTTQVTATWLLQDDIFEYDIWLKWSRNEPLVILPIFDQRSILNAQLLDINPSTGLSTTGRIKYTTTWEDFGLYGPTHPYKVGDIVTVKGDGSNAWISAEDYIVEEVPDNYNFIITNKNYIGSSYTYNPRAYEIINKSLTNNVATLTTSTNHNFVIGDVVKILGTDPAEYPIVTPRILDGIYTITATTPTTFSYVIKTSSIIEKRLFNNTATLKTSSSHNLNTGDVVVISGVDATFNGTYTVSSVTSSNFFSYEKISSNVPTTVVNPVGSVVSNKANILPTQLNPTAMAVKNSDSSFIGKVTEENWIYVGRVSGNSISFYAKEYPLAINFSIRVYVPHYPITHNNDYLIFAYLDRSIG